MFDQILGVFYNPLGILALMFLSFGAFYELVLRPLIWLWKWDMLPGRSLALRRAEAVAKVLLTSPRVSFVKNGAGRLFQAISFPLLNRNKRVVCLNPKLLKGVVKH